MKKEYTVTTDSSLLLWGLGETKNRRKELCAKASVQDYWSKLQSQLQLVGETKVKEVYIYFFFNFHDKVNE